MRTLFLLGIMFFLWVIAVKEPNQSTWEAAKVIGSKVDTAVSNIKEKPISKTIGLVSKGKAWGKLASGIGKNNPSDIPPIRTAKPDRPKASVPPPAVAKPLAKASPPPAVVREIAPRPRVASLPRIPAVPVAPVKVAEIGSTPPPLPPVVNAKPVAAVSPKPVPVVWKYEQVKSFYENASRLLAEIK